MVAVTLKRDDVSESGFNGDGDDQSHGHLPAVG